MIKNIKNTLNKKAFTLAEVLITLAIIGIVATMTVKTLIQNSEERSYMSALTKNYAVITNAYNLAVADNGTPDSWDLTTDPSPNILNKLIPFLNISKDCTDGSTGCWAKNVNYLRLDPTLGGSQTYDSQDYPKIKLTDGTSILGRVFTTNCITSYGTSKELKNICGTYYIDINGDKKPNQWGKDVFALWVTKYGIVPRGSAQDTIYSFSSDCNGAAGVNQYGGSCAGWVLTNQNMDYLHCNGLNWNTKNKCN